MSDLQKARERFQEARANYWRAVAVVRQASDECMAACKALDHLEARAREPVSTPEVNP